MPMTREQIENLSLGDRVIRKHMGRNPDGETVVEIFAKGVSDFGNAYACFYTQWSEGSRMSGSVMEGEDNFDLVTDDNTFRVECVGCGKRYTRSREDIRESASGVPAMTLDCGFVPLTLVKFLP